MNSKNKRRKIYVSRAIQGRILWRMVRHWLFYNLAIWHALLLIDFHRTMVTGLAGGAPRLGLVDFYCEFASQHILLLVVSLTFAPVVLWDMLKLTHQIAGPLVRFQNTLWKMTTGRPVPKVALRDGDLLVEFKDAFNAFLESGRLIVGEQPVSRHETAVASREGAILAAIAELQKELKLAGSEQTSAAKAAATIA
jgi:hypothetical protein